MLFSTESKKIIGPIRANAGVPIHSSYLHILNGRIRIKLADVKGQPLNASRVEKTLYQIDGVTHVKANPTTGNILILFDPDAICDHHILEVICSLELPKGQLCRNAADDLSVQRVAKVLAKEAAKSIGKQLFYFGVQLAVDRISLGLIPANAWRLRL